MEHNYYSVCAPDYAEVDTHSMATFYKRDLPCVLAPYATTTLINAPKQANSSVYDSKSSSSEISRKSDKPHDMNSRLNEDEQHDPLLNKSLQSNGSGNYSNDDYANQGRKIMNKFLQSSSRAPVVNWSDIIPPPPDHPPTEKCTSPATSWNLSPVKGAYQFQGYQGNLVNKIGSSSPWSTLGRTGIDMDPFNASLIFGMKHSGMQPPRTLPQNFGQSNTLTERSMQSSGVPLMNEQFPCSGRRISQNGVIPTAGGSFPYFLKPSTSDTIHQKYAVFPGLQNTSSIPDCNAAEDGERIELNNMFLHRSSLTDQTSCPSARSSGNSSFFEDNIMFGGKNEYYNRDGIKLFDPECNAGKAQTSVRNRSSRPPSSYSSDGNSGTVPARTSHSKHKWKEHDTIEKNQGNDDIPSYNKPTFPSCSSSSSQSPSSVGRRRREFKGLINELSPLSTFSSLSEKYGNTSTDEKPENKEVLEDRK